MRRLGVVLAALAVTALWGSPALAQTSEVIHSYDVAIEIRADDSIRVTEVIAYDFGSSPHHGIFRDVPTREAYDDRYDRVYPLHVESVEATGGASADYEVSQEPGGITRIKIGDPDETITGAHTYTIVYTVEAAMNGFRDHDELYWNAIGDVLGGARRDRDGDRERTGPHHRHHLLCRACQLDRAVRQGADPRGRDGPLPAVEPVPVRGVHGGRGVAQGRRRGTEATAGGAVEHRPCVLANLLHARSVRRPAPAPGRGMWLAVLDAWARPPFRRLAGRPDDGQRHRRRAGGAAVRARRRPRRVRSTGGPPPGPGGHDHRRAGEHPRRHRDDRGPGRPRVPHDRGDPEGRLVRQAGLDVASHGQGGRRSAHVRIERSCPGCSRTATTRRCPACDARSRNG